MDTRKQTKTQFDKFKQAASGLECDESEAAFDRALKAVAKAKQADEKNPKKASGKK